MVGGSLDVTGDGSVSLSSGTSTGGAFSIASGASLGLGSEFSEYSVDPTTTISGTGSLGLGANPTMVLPANYNFAGSTEVYTGVLQVDGSLDRHRNQCLGWHLERDRDGRRDVRRRGGGESG